jgi:hypothetical protein
VTRSPVRLNLTRSSRAPSPATTCRRGKDADMAKVRKVCESAIRSTVLSGTERRICGFLLCCHSSWRTLRRPGTSGADMVCLKGRQRCFAPTRCSVSMHRVLRQGEALHAESDRDGQCDVHFDDVVLESCESQVRVRCDHSVAADVPRVPVLCTIMRVRSASCGVSLASCASGNTSLSRKAPRSDSLAPAGKYSRSWFLRAERGQAAAHDQGDHHGARHGCVHQWSVRSRRIALRSAFDPKCLALFVQTKSACTRSRTLRRPITL